MAGRVERLSSWAASRSWIAEAQAGVNVAPMMLPSLMATGVILMQPLGHEWLPLGIGGAILACAAVALLRAVCGGDAMHINAARPTQAAMLAALMAEIGSAGQVSGADPQLRAMVMVSAAALALMLAGLMQCGLGYARVGSIIRFVPFPVIAGFSNGFAVTIALGQVPHLAGFPSWSALIAAMADVSAASPWPLAVGSLSLATTLLVQRHRPRWPAGLAGLLSGTLAHALLALAIPVAAVGARIGSLPGELPMTFGGAGIAELVQESALMPEVAGSILATAAALALVSSLQSLVSLASVDAMRRRRSDGDRELIRQGLGNIAAALLCAPPVGGSPLYTKAALAAGGGGRVSQLCLSLLLLASIALSGLIGIIPVAAMAGVLIGTTLTLLDPWSLGLLRRLWHAKRETHWTSLAADLLIVAIVSVLIAVSGAISALSVGIILSAMMYLVRSGGDVVRRVQDGTQLRSETERDMRALALLEEHGAAIRIVTLRGPLFFGSAERLADRIAMLPGAAALILDVSRTSTIDSTGIEVLRRVDRELQGRWCTLSLAGMPPSDAHRLMLGDLGWTDIERSGRVFADLNAALAAAEDRLLDAMSAKVTTVEIERHPALLGLDPPQLDLVAAVLERHAPRAGQQVAVQGQPSDRIWLVTAGQFTAHRQERDGAMVRVRSFRPGATIGEEALLVGGSWRHTVAADCDSMAYVLLARDLEMLGRIDWRIPFQVLRNIAIALQGQTMRLERLAAERGA
jgi:MFS superfamily sulfate permease-like transporter